jgi:hypothetical protein
MKDNLLKALYDFQTCEFDHDMVGMCKAYVDWLKILRQEISGDLPENEKPDNFYKLDPHLPRMELRENVRDFLAAATKKQKQEVDINVRMLNLYVGVLASMYAYHMPTDKIIEASKLDTEFTRKDAEKLLLDDNMSPNWIKEPSGTDFSAVMP